MMPPVLQFIRFAIIGGGATLIHLGAALTLNTALDLSPLRANFCAFLAAAAVSYWGNFVWTFGAAGAHEAALPKFLVLSLALFAINQGIVHVATELWDWPFLAALVPVVVIVPVGGFLASRFWAFRPRQMRV